MKTYEGVDVSVHVFLTSALVGGEWSDSRSHHFTYEKTPRTNWLRRWLCPRASLNFVKTRKILPLLIFEPLTSSPYSVHFKYK
jgi:hypothetical protein